MRFSHVIYTQSLFQLYVYTTTFLHYQVNNIKLPYANIFYIIRYAKHKQTLENDFSFIIQQTTKIHYHFIYRKKMKKHSLNKRINASKGSIHRNISYKLQ